MANLSFCSCLETLQTEDSAIHSDAPSKNLPDVSLRGVATLKRVTVLGWHPKNKFTLPPGCLLGLAVVLETQAQWEEWQRKGCPTTLLYLMCMKLRAWPAGIADVSGLQYLELHSTRMKDQDLAALQHIPRVFVYVKKSSSFLLTTGSWQRLEVSGRHGFTPEDFQCRCICQRHQAVSICEPQPPSKWNVREPACSMHEARGGLS